MFYTQQPPVGCVSFVGGPETYIYNHKHRDHNKHLRGVDKHLSNSSLLAHALCYDN